MAEPSEAEAVEVGYLYALGTTNAVEEEVPGRVEEEDEAPAEESEEENAYQWRTFVKQWEQECSASVEQVQGQGSCSPGENRRYYDWYSTNQPKLWHCPKYFAIISMLSRMLSSN